MARMSIGWIGGDTEEELASGLAFYADHDFYIDRETNLMTPELAWEWCVELGGAMRQSQRQRRVCERAAAIHNEKVGRAA